MTPEEWAVNFRDLAREPSRVRSSRDWIAYIQSELTALCLAKGWRHQIRRRWTARAKPVSESGLGDYEWKVRPYADDRSDGTGWDAPYFVVRLNRSQSKFILIHDTIRGGEWAHKFWYTTYTVIRIPCWDDGLPPKRWLAFSLSDLTETFKPNRFSWT